MPARPDRLADVPGFGIDRVFSNEPVERLEALGERLRAALEVRSDR